MVSTNYRSSFDFIDLRRSVFFSF